MKISMLRHCATYTIKFVIALSASPPNTVKLKWDCHIEVIRDRLVKWTPHRVRNTTNALNPPSRDVHKVSSRLKNSIEDLTCQICSSDKKSG